MSRVVFVVGCSGGLGLATVSRLIQNHDVVYATVRRVEDKKQLEKICNYSQNLHVLLMDLTNDKSIEESIKTVLSHHDIDALVFNAASIVIGPPDALTSEEVETLFKVNVFSVIQVVQALLPRMRERRKGNLIFIGSTTGIESCGFLGGYSASKFALESLVASWASILHRWNIHTTIIEPGGMNTQLLSKVSFGSYYSSNHLEDPYSNLNQNAFNFLQKVLQDGTDPHVVAELILEVLATSTPLLRYQTCVYSKGVAQRHLRDPESKEWLKEHRGFLEGFFS